MDPIVAKLCARLPVLNLRGFSDGRFGHCQGCYATDSPACPNVARYFQLSIYISATSNVELILIRQLCTRCNHVETDSFTIMTLKVLPHVSADTLSAAYILSDGIGGVLPLLTCVWGNSRKGTQGADFYAKLMSGETT